MIYTAALTTYNLQRVRSVFAYVFQIFCRQAADVFYVVVLTAWAVEDNVSFHCDKRIELAEEAKDYVF